MNGLDTDGLVKALQEFRDALMKHRSVLNDLNVYPVPDGDTGTNMARTLEAVCEAAKIGKAVCVRLAVGTSGSVAMRRAVCAAVSSSAVAAGRGNSGLLISAVLRGLARAFDIPDDMDNSAAAPAIDGACMAEALTAASDAASTALTAPVEGTILSVARDVAQAAAATVDSQPEAGRVLLVSVLENARREGQSALERTPDLLPVLAEAGVVDSGAAGFLLLLDALLCAADGRPMPDVLEVPASVQAVLAKGQARLPSSTEMHAHLGDAHGGHDVSETRYEVMFLLDAENDRIEAFKQEWSELGDSVVVVGGDGTWNCHIHTDHTEPVIETGRRFGDVSRVEITDLHAQIESLASQHGPPQAVTANDPATPVACAVVAIAPTPSLGKLFQRFGAQQIVLGGLQMNPSVAEIMEAVVNAPSQQVVIVPCGSGAASTARMLAAERAAGKTVLVADVCTIAAGLIAVNAHSPDNDADSDLAEMNAAATVTAGEIAPGVWHGTWFDGDGSLRHETAAPTSTQAAVDMLDSTLNDTHEIVTLFAGAGASDNEIAEIGEWLDEHWPALTVEVHRSGQEHHRYLLAVE